jgi:hypothetical protein
MLLKYIPSIYNKIQKKIYLPLIIRLAQIHNNIITAVLKNNILRKRGSNSPERYQNAYYNYQEKNNRRTTSFSITY